MKLCKVDQPPETEKKIKTKNAFEERWIYNFVKQSLIYKCIQFFEVISALFHTQKLCSYK